MGADPIGVLTVVRYPKELPDSEFDSLLEGARAAAASNRCELLGGDTGSAERLILSASALGICERGKVLMRSNARPGDLVCLTGSVGTAAAAIFHFARPADPQRTALSKDSEARLLRAWRRPEPRVAAGRLLATAQLATSCQDVSDGLRATAREIAAASNVRLLLDERAVPIDDVVREVAFAAAIDPTALALSASVDFELLFTTPASMADALHSDFEAAGLPLFVIGEVSEGEGALLRRQDGSTADLPGVEWRHQQENVGALFQEYLSVPPGN